MEAHDAPPSPATAPRRRRVLRWLAACALALAALLGAGYALLGSQVALDYVLRRATAAGAGRLTLDGGAGSLLSTVHVDRIAWRGDDVDVEAHDVVLAWSPFDLVSRRFEVQRLHAQRLAITVRPRGSAGGLPASLALPLEVNVRNIGVERLEWQVGQRGGFMTGVAFAYTGGAQRHAVRDLRFATVDGMLTGAAEVAATPPFALSSALGFTGAGTWEGANARLAANGTLDRVALDGSGALRNADIRAQATLAPFAPVLVVAAAVEARAVDLAQFAPALPATALTVKVVTQPAGAGFAGTLDARNETAGPVSAGRVPVAALAARFAWDGARLTLSDVDARASGGGRVTGTIAVPADGATAQLDLTLADIDLARIHAALATTRLSGTVAGEVAANRQVVRGDVRQAGMTLAFAATIADRRVTVERFAARANGEISGSGSFDFDAPRAFRVDAKASRFDPARFIDLPATQLDGTVAARGMLAPAWDVTAEVALAEGSRVTGVAVHGKARAHVTPDRARDVAVDARVATAAVTLSGAFGAPGDALAYAIDVPRLSDLKPLLARFAPGLPPEAIAGTLRARGTLTGGRDNPGATIDAHGGALQWGRALRVGSVDIAGRITPAAGRGGVDTRPVSLDVAVTKLGTPQGVFPTARAAVAGTLAAHRGTLAVTGEGLDLTAAFAGGMKAARRTDGTSEELWSGTLDAFANRGTYALKLEAPAAVEIARDHVHVGAARLAVAEGRAELTRLAIDEGRITTSGSFTGIPAAVVARLAGTPLPFPSTLALGGTWSLAAAPRLNGTLDVHRERGDWFAAETATGERADLALGITEFALTARFTDDALAAEARFRSARAGNANAVATLAAGRTPGRIATDAPLTARLDADLASLRPLQPWVGTLAVMDGRAQVALDAKGTLAQPVFAGTATGDALRFDLPQYGVHLVDGRLRARLADRALLLDEFSFAGGKGRFTAKGTLARAADAPAGGATAHVEWQAEDFTVVNRPDMRIVADGNGTLAVVDKRIELTGNVSIDEGNVVYTPSRVGTLGDDVVIVGQPRAPPSGGATGNLPLALDLEVTLGRNFRFSGEGLETRLAGNVHLRTTPAGTLAANGTIRAVAGTYFVFGQRLDIDRGRLIFDGPADNPALDVVALRKNLAVEAGVELTGTVRVPRVRLVSNPPVPDGEKLSWLLTGQGLDRANRADLAALSAASASLLGQGQKPITTRIANAVGLDDISVRDAGSSATAGATGQVVSFGKRISDRLTLVYEQGLTLATNALRIEYTLTRSLTLRAEAGTVGSVGIYFRRSYD